MELAFVLVLAMISVLRLSGTGLRFRFSRAASGFQDGDVGRQPAIRVPFHLSHGVLIVIKGQIANLSNLRFVLDTGTSRTVVDRRVADKLHLSCQRGGAVLNFNRSLRLRRCSLPDIEIGSFRVKELPVSAARLADLSTLLDDADVLIGLDLLGSSKFTIDYKFEEVVFERLEQPVRKSQVVKTDPDDPVPMTVIIRVQGHPIRLILDTGMDGVMLYENRLRKKVPHLQMLGSAETVYIGGFLPAKRVTLPGVQFGRSATNSVVLLISVPRSNTLPGIDGLLGPSALGARQLTLDFIGKTMTWGH